MKKSYYILSILFLLGSSVMFSASDSINNDNIIRSEAPTSIFERLSKQKVLEISVRTNIDQLLTKKKPSSYQTAFIKLKESAETDREWTVQIKTRGKYRKRVCEFPPLKVKFDHSVLGPENLKAYKSLKLVTHCGDRAEAEELLLKEYLTYKMYNTITNQSLRVQLVKINWIDSKGNHEIGEKWGFLIENADELAQRLGGEVYEEFGVQHDDLNATSAANNSLFQYMVGNPDWSVENDKNIKLIKSNTSNDIMIIPYDFDFCGVVNSYYAVTSLGLTSVQERIYLGGSNQEEINKAIVLFNSKKEAVLELINSFDHLNKSERNKIKKYVKTFYSSLDEPLKRIDFYQDRIAAKKVVKAKKDNSTL